MIQITVTRRSFIGGVLATVAAARLARRPRQLSSEDDPVVREFADFPYTPVMLPGDTLQVERGGGDRFTALGTGTIVGIRIHRSRRVFGVCNDGSLLPMEFA